jgi:hypothetical protein
MSPADAVFSHCRFVWLGQTNVPVVFLDPGINRTASLPNVNVVGKNKVSLVIYIYVDVGVVDRNAVWACKYVPVIQRNILPPALVLELFVGKFSEDQHRQIHHCKNSIPKLYTCFSSHIVGSQIRKECSFMTCPLHL